MAVSRYVVYKQAKSAAFRNPLRLVGSLSLPNRNFLSGLRDVLRATGNAARRTASFGDRLRRRFWDVLLLDREAARRLADEKGVVEDPEKAKELFSLTKKTPRFLKRLIRSFADKAELGLVQRYSDDIVMDQLIRQSFTNLLGPFLGTAVDFVVRDFLNFYPTYKQLAAYGPEYRKPGSYVGALGRILSSLLVRSPYSSLASAVASSRYAPKTARKIANFLDKYVVGGPIYTIPNMGVLGLSGWMIGNSIARIPELSVSSLALGAGLDYDPEYPELGRKRYERFMERFDLKRLVAYLLWNELKRPWMPTDPVSDLHSEFIKENLLDFIGEGMQSGYYNMPYMSTAVPWIWPNGWQILTNYIRTRYGKGENLDQHRTDKARLMLKKYLAWPYHRGGYPRIRYTDIRRTPLLDVYTDALTADEATRFLAGILHRSRTDISKQLHKMVEDEQKLTELSDPGADDEVIFKNHPDLLALRKLMKLRGYDSIKEFEEDFNNFRAWIDMVEMAQSAARVVNYLKHLPANNSKFVEQTRKENLGLILGLMAQFFLNKEYLTPSMRESLIDLAIGPYTSGRSYNSGRPLRVDFGKGSVELDSSDHIGRTLAQVELFPDVYLKSYELEAEDFKRRNVQKLIDEILRSMGDPLFVRSMKRYDPSDRE